MNQRETDAAIGHYLRLLKRQPGLATAHFNLALLYKKNKRYVDAVAAYEEAVSLGIRDVQEVYSNMGVLYSEMRLAEKAADMYERALAVEPGYIPALFNRAGLFEETGKRLEATELYRRILSIDPGHWGALARLAYAHRANGVDNGLVDLLKDAIDKAKDNQPAREELFFALGKTLDDLGRYDDSFAAYRAGNDIGRLRNAPYNRLETEQAFERLIALFSPDWIENLATGSTAAPIFICGMFRSGSSLVEQVLAAHPSVSAGGELDYLTWLIAGRLSPYPDRVVDASREDLQQLGNEYLSRLQDLFPGRENITDKRPDNFLHLGLIKALFPSARIVYTKRTPADNCLSIYFQQLGGNLAYATDLENTAHYYGQHERLMLHWDACFRENIFTVDYDALVRSPELELRRLFDFLGLEWDDRCLAFHEADNPVKTASVWQVREGLHSRSSGRWRNYEPYVRNIQVHTLCMQADAARRQSRFDRAAALLKSCLDIAPDYKEARHNYAVVLLRQNRLTEALQQTDRLLADEPENTGLSKLKAAILLRQLEYDGAIEIYENILESHPEQPKVWANLGHALRTVGQVERCVDAYRKAIALAPDFGEAFWNLANLKTFRMTDSELETMRLQLQKPELGYEDRIHFNFAIGKALEDRGAFSESFRHYGEGNRLRRRNIHYDADDMADYVQRFRKLFTPEFFAERTDYGAIDDSPIFIVGLPRSGSTLVEQILASHSAVEGTMELPHVADIAKRLVVRDAGRETAGYPDVLANLGQGESRELGQRYIERTRDQRKRGTPLFIDKQPNNFVHLSLIQLILPNARIVDVRRHPLACGLSLFKHLFAKGQHFSYSLEDVGRYYRDYVELMTHFDAILPGRVHRIVYESLVDDTGTEVRRLLEYCGLPFEESCLTFFANKRAVSTPSSEQVRMPIYRDAVDHWKHYEPWLGPLKAVL